MGKPPHRAAVAILGEFIIRPDEKPVTPEIEAISAMQAVEESGKP